MAQFLNMFPVELENGQPAIVSLAQMHQGNAKANRVGAIVFQGGQPAALGGSCSGTAILANGATVALMGTISGNQAFCDLPDACYSMEGPIEVFITITSGSTQTTLMDGFGTVRRTESGTIIDPGTIIPSVADLIAQIDEAMATIPADYTALMAAVASTFSASDSYEAGRYVWYSGVLYKFTEDHAAGAWTGLDAISAALGNDLSHVKNDLEKIAVFSPNLLDKDHITLGKYLSSNNAEITDANAFISNFFPCEPNEYFITKYSPYLGYGFITLYDQDKQYIASINGWRDGDFSCYRAGSAGNIAFARICNQVSNLDGLMIVSGQQYPAQYYGYGENKIRKEALPAELWEKIGPDDIADAVFLNLFDKSTAIDGEYVESTTGAFSYSATYWRSGFIPVKASTAYRASGNNRVAFYDANKIYIIGYNGQYAYTSPANAAYLVICNTPLASKDTFVLAEAVNYDGTYHKYGVKIPWLIDDAPRSKYAGKKLVCFGDSITNYGYTATINEDTGMDAVNVGLSSGRYAYSDDSDQYINAFAFYRIVDAISIGDWTIPDSISGVSGYETQYAHIQTIKSIDFDEIDFVSIAYGTNDFSSATPLDNANNPLDTNTFKGAIRYCLKLLTEKYPHLKIIGVTPCYRFWAQNGVILYDSDNHAIGGLYLKQYVDAVQDVFAEYHLPTVDNYTLAGINKYNCLQYFSISDGLHPNANGRAIIGHRIGNGILNNY